MGLLRRDRLARTALIFVIVTAVVALVFVAGRDRVIAGRAVMSNPATGQAVEWGPCHIAGGGPVKIPKDAQCGSVVVPVDYDKPDGDTAQLAMIRFPAMKDKIASLVINPGGPGESGVEAAVAIVHSLPQQVRERFDLVGFDPRGVASSLPAVWCNSDADNDRDRADPQVDYSPAGVARIENDTKDYVQRCVEKVGDEFLANLGTVNVARDLDAIRSALGDDKLTYLGYSYGTRIGSTYAEAYPQNVRAMILDGAIDPNTNPIEEDLRQAASFQDIFDNYAADCAESANCPLGTDPDQAVDVYRGLVEPLVDAPVATKDPRGLGYNDAIIATIMALYSPAFWTHLSDGLTELSRGRGDTILLLADVYMGRDADGHYNNATDARIAVNCVDQPPVTDRAAVIDEDRRAREVAPFLSYGEFTGHAPLGTCAFWPVPATSEPHTISAPGLAPTMVVSTTHDPATPYQAGVELAEQLNGGLLTFDGTQHTVAFQGNDCVDEFATDYLIDGTVPPTGAQC